MYFYIVLFLIVPTYIFLSVRMQSGHDKYISTKSFAIKSFHNNLVTFCAIQEKKTTPSVKLQQMPP